MKYLFKIHTLIIIAVLALFFINKAYSQVPSLLWSKTYNHTNKDDAAYGCTNDSSGFLYVTGSVSNSGSSDFFDLITLKYNPANGDTIWKKIYNGTANKDDVGMDVVVSNDGSLYVVGYTNISTTGTDNQMLIIKYNSTTGAVVWVRTFGLSSGTVPDEMAYGCTYYGGNLYVTGERFYSPAIGSNILTLKYTAAGDTVWTAEYNGSANKTDAGFNCAVNNQGNLFISGYEDMGSFYRLAVLKYTTSGSLSMVKYSSDILEYNTNFMFSGCVSSGSFVYVTGLAGNNSNRYGLLMKYNDNLDTAWVKRNDSPSIYDQNINCTFDHMGDMYVSGTRYNGVNDDLMIQKYKSFDGFLYWTLIFNHPSNNSDYAFDCSTDRTGYLYAAGMVNYNNGNSDLFAGKYQSTIGITQISGIVPENYQLLQNYPNPFNPSCKIRFRVAHTSDIKLIVYDALGCTIQTLISQQVIPGTYETEFSGENYPSGIYFYKLITDSFTDTKKMVLVK